MEHTAYFMRRRRFFPLLHFFLSQNLFMAKPCAVVTSGAPRGPCQLQDPFLRPRGDREVTAATTASRHSDAVHSQEPFAGRVERGLERELGGRSRRARREALRNALQAPSSKAHIPELEKKRFRNI